MSKVDILLQHMVHIVVTCIGLHNICTIGNNFFDMN